MLNNYSFKHPTKKVLSKAQKKILGACLIGGIIFIAALFGILTRPIGFLASFWPANALLLGFLLRYPSQNNLLTWSLASFGFIAADLLTGNTLMLTLALTGANLSFALSGLYLFRHLPIHSQRLDKPIAVIYLTIICFFASLFAAIIAVIFARPLAPSIFGNDLIEGVGSWLTADFVNSLLILPVILAAPSIRFLMQERKINYRLNIAEYSNKKSAMHLAPFIALVISNIAAIIIGGPGAIAFHVPALMWCALHYQVFTTTLLTLIISVWLIIATDLHIIQLIPNVLATNNLMDLSISIRLGISLISLIPLTIVILSKSNNQLMHQLIQAAKYDFLTAALSRSAFYQSAQEVIASSFERHISLTVVMMDIDHFKQVNDRYGHAAGDQVLKQFSRLVQDNLRKEDLFARLGGEEFALVMQGNSVEDSMEIAERIRQQLQNHLIAINASMQIQVTVSIGVAHFATLPHHLIDVLLAEADQALYMAKRAGRNQTSYRPST